MSFLKKAIILQGDPWVITPTTPDPEAALLQMADVGHEGNGPEAGLAAALWALSPPSSMRPTAESAETMQPFTSLSCPMAMTIAMNGWKKIQLLPFEDS